MESKIIKYSLYALVFSLLAFNCKKRESPLPGLVRGYEVIDSRQSPGYVLQVMKGDSVLLEQMEGVEDLATRKPISAKSLFNTGSISKTFVAYAILHLAHEGRIHLNDSLLKYFPDFKNQGIGKKVTLYHLSPILRAFRTTGRFRKTACFTSPLTMHKTGPPFFKTIPFILNRALNMNIQIPPLMPSPWSSNR